MQEALAQVSTYVWGIWRHRWLALVSAWLLAVAGWIGVSQLPDAYAATARVYVDSNTVLAPLLKGLAIQPNINQRISLMSRTLLSRPNLEKLMRMADLDLLVETDLEKEEYLDELEEKISLEGDRSNASLYSIAFVNEDRTTAKRIVQALITVFIESTLGEKREDSSGAQEFLDQQISDYELRLIEAEERLADFKQRYVGSLPGEGGDYYKRLELAKRNLSESRLKLSEMQNRRDELKRQLAGEEPVFLGSGSSTGQGGGALESRIQILQSNMDILLTRYTEKHPEVVQIKALIAELEEERKQELESAMEAGDSSYAGITDSPVYQDMRSMLAEAEATVAERAVRVQEYADRVQTLEDKVNNIPIIETELKQLTRDYAVIQAQHASLLERRESALISQEVEKNANDVTFRVVDPPFVPLRPSEPNKLLLRTAVLFAAIGIGVGLSLLMSMLRPVVGDQRTLNQLTGLPFLGAVTIIRPPAERRKKLLAVTLYSSLSFLLLVAFTGVAIVPELEWIL